MPGFLPAQETISQAQGRVSSERHIHSFLYSVKKNKTTKWFCFVENDYFFSSLKLIAFGKVPLLFPQRIWRCS